MIFRNLYKQNFNKELKKIFDKVFKFKGILKFLNLTELTITRGQSTPDCDLRQFHWENNLLSIV